MTLSHKNFDTKRCYLIDFLKNLQRRYLLKFSLTLNISKEEKGERKRLEDEGTTTGFKQLLSLTIHSRTALKAIEIWQGKISPFRHQMSQDS